VTRIALSWLRQPLLSERPATANLRTRGLLFLLWLAVTLTLAINHVPWRDEARAWLLMLQGDSWGEMFRAVQGEGHPFLWYMLLRAGNDLFGTPDVLPVIGLLIGIPTVALLVFRAPFRLGLLAVLIFSLHLGFEFTVHARNYGIAALVMLAIAARWPRIRDNLWLGGLLLILCNTNVPSVFLAGSFYLYRLLELWSEQRDLRAPEWRRAVLNGILLALGALLCFLAVYPPANEAAADAAALPLTPINLAEALLTSQRSFTAIGFGSGSLFGQTVLLASLLLFVHRPRALIVATVALVCLKLFFFFIYPGYYRHSALFFIFMVALLWIEAGKGWLEERREQGTGPALIIGSAAFLLLMVMQTSRYIHYPIGNLWLNRPYSHAADLAAILNRPDLRGAMLMIDPDTMGESVAFQTGKPFWLIRQHRPGTVVPLLRTGNKDLTLDRLLQQAAELQAQTNKPVVIALALPIDDLPAGSYDQMFRDYTRLTPEGVARFKAATRKVATLREGGGDEQYDVYVYPR
jgi:hypothetical protein